jgi:hypothetical protein
MIFVRIMKEKLITLIVISGIKLILAIISELRIQGFRNDRDDSIKFINQKKLRRNLCRNLNPQQKVYPKMRIAN